MIVLDSVLVSFAENDDVVDIVLDVSSEVTDSVLTVVVFENMGVSEPELVSGVVLVSRVVTGADDDVVVVDDVSELEVITTIVVVGKDTEDVVISSDIVVDSVELACGVFTSSGVAGISVELLVTVVSSGVVRDSLEVL